MFVDMAEKFQQKKGDRKPAKNGGQRGSEKHTKLLLGVYLKSNSNCCLLEESGAINVKIKMV